MAARGTSSKNIIVNKIMSVFPSSFLTDNGKTLRIPLIEDGEPIEIKVTFTAAKDILQSAPIVEEEEDEVPWYTAADEPSAQEKDYLAKLLASL